METISPASQRPYHLWLREQRSLYLLQGTGNILEHRWRLYHLWLREQLSTVYLLKGTGTSTLLNKLRQLVCMLISNNSFCRACQNICSSLSLMRFAPSWTETGKSINYCKRFKFGNMKKIRYN